MLHILTNEVSFLVMNHSIITPPLNLQRVAAGVCAFKNENKSLTLPSPLLLGALNVFTV